VTIHLPEDLERFAREQVQTGRFSSLDEVIREALERLRAQTPIIDPGLGSIGAMREDAELLDQAVAHAMRAREERTWRSSPDE